MIVRLPQTRRRFDWTGPALSLILVGALLTSAKSQTRDAGSQPPATQPTRPRESHQIKVPVLSETPVLGRLFTSEVQEPTTRPVDNEAKIRSLVDHTKALIDGRINNNFEEALATVNEILKLDPNNVYAKGVKPLLEDKVNSAGGKTAAPSTADLVKRITSLIERCHDLMDADEYDSALDTVNEILRLNPEDAYAREVKPRVLEKIQSQRRTLTQLDRQLPSVTFDAVGFSDVLDFLRDVSGANIFVNWKALEAAKIDRNTPVTAHLRNIKFSKVLNIILDSVGGGQTKLGYTVDEGVISISTQDDLSRNVVVRVYDIRDLLIIVPDFSSTPDSAKPVPTAPPPTREDLAKQLTKTIMDTVSTDSWKDRGGQVGALRELEGQLIITQTPQNHRRIVALLEQLREERSIQINVETRFVSCDHKLIDDLLEQWGQSAKKAASGNDHPTTRPSGTPASGSETTGVFLTEPELAQFLKLIQSAPESIITTSPRVTLWNGQRASVRVSSSQAYLSGYTPTAKGNGEVRYEPVVKSVDHGILLDLTATVSADRRYVTVSLHPQVTTLLGFDRVPWPGSPKNVDLMVQEPKTKTSEISTTISIPDCGSVLLSGLEDPRFGREASGSPTTHPASSRGIYLLVRPTIIRSVSLEQPNFPLLAPKAPK